MVRGRPAAASPRTTSQDLSPAGEGSGRKTYRGGWRVPGRKVNPGSPGEAAVAVHGAGVEQHGSSATGSAAVSQSAAGAAPAGGARRAAARGERLKSTTRTWKPSCCRSMPLSRRASPARAAAGPVRWTAEVEPEDAEIGPRGDDLQKRCLAPLPVHRVGDLEPAGEADDGPAAPQTGIPARSPALDHRGRGLLEATTSGASSGYGGQTVIAPDARSGMW